MPFIAPSHTLNSLIARLQALREDHAGDTPIVVGFCDHEATPPPVDVTFRIRDVIPEVALYRDKVLIGLQKDQPIIFMA